MKNLLRFIGFLSIYGFVNATDYAEGQVWSYKTREGEERSRVLINKIEIDEKLGKIFHISLSGLNLKNPRIDGGYSDELPHLPVSEETLKKSLVKLLDSGTPNPNYVDGYDTWKKAFDSGETGIFSISISEIVGFIEGQINKTQTSN